MGPTAFWPLMVASRQRRRASATRIGGELCRTRARAATAERPSDPAPVRPPASMEMPCSRASPPSLSTCATGSSPAQVLAFQAKRLAPFGCPPVRPPQLSPTYARCSRCLPRELSPCAAPRFAPRHRPPRFIGLNVAVTEFAVPTHASTTATKAKLAQMVRVTEFRFGAGVALGGARSEKGPRSAEGWSDPLELRALAVRYGRHTASRCQSHRGLPSMVQVAAA
jgi:hypothetical protein